jgi:hypothetical protein
MIMRIVIVFAALLAAACHPPRSPRDVAEGTVDGAWHGESASVGEPRDSGTVAWRLTLQQSAAGKLDGRGSVQHGDSATSFRLSGQRGENEVTLQFELLGAPVRYHGSLLDPKTITGEMQMPHDTLHVTLTRD